METYYDNEHTISRQGLALVRLGSSIIGKYYRERKIKRKHEQKVRQNVIFFPGHITHNKTRINQSTRYIRSARTKAYTKYTYTVLVPVCTGTLHRS